MSEPCKCLPGYFNDVLADHQTHGIGKVKFKIKQFLD